MATQSARALLFSIPLSSSPASQSLNKGSGVSCACSRRSDPSLNECCNTLLAMPCRSSPVCRWTPSQACSSRLAPAPAAHRLRHPRQPWAHASGCSAPAEGAPAPLSVFASPAQLWVSKLLLAGIKRIKFASVSSTESCWRKGVIRKNIAIDTDGA